MGRNAQNGLLTGTTLGSVTDTLNYSAFAEISGYAASAGPSQLYSESYTRDNLGRITQRTEILQGATTTWGYVYDMSGRLQSVTRNGAAFESYTYDANDNRLTKTTTAGTASSVVDNQDRLISSTGLGGAQSWTYDSNGDLLTRATSVGTTVFDYETSGQLLSVTKPGGQVVSYDLDAGNKRASKKLNGVVQRKWLYAGGLLPVAEYDVSNNLTALFNGAYLVKNGTTYRLLRDHLGSVRLVVDASTGVVAQRLSYGPWGEVLEDTNPGFQPFGYAGGLYDPDTGLVRFGARDYDPSVGRWTCKDPIGLNAGANVYKYCADDPVGMRDPSGLDVSLWVEPQRPGVNDEGHAWIEVDDPDTGETYSIGAWPHGGLKSPDGDYSPSHSNANGPYKLAQKWNTTPDEDRAIIRGLKDAHSKQKDAKEWYDLTARPPRVCTTSAVELLRRLLPKRMLPANHKNYVFKTDYNLPWDILQPNNFYNYWHPGELPKGELKYGPLVVPY